MVNALVIPQTIQAAIYSLAYVAHGLSRWTHMYILNVPLQPGQGREAFVAWLASEFVHTWRQKGPISLSAASQAMYTLSDGFKTIYDCFVVDYVFERLVPTCHFVISADIRIKSIRNYLKAIHSEGIE